VRYYFLDGSHPNREDARSSTIHATDDANKNTPPARCASLAAVSAPPAVIGRGKTRVSHACKGLVDIIPTCQNEREVHNIARERKELLKKRRSTRERSCTCGKQSHRPSRRRRRRRRPDRSRSPRTSPRPPRRPRRRTPPRRRPRRRSRRALRNRSKDVRSGVERRRGRCVGIENSEGRWAERYCTCTPGSKKVLKDRRSPRERGRKGTSVIDSLPSKSLGSATTSAPLASPKMLSLRIASRSLIELETTKDSCSTPRNALTTDAIAAAAAGCAPKDHPPHSRPSAAPTTADSSRKDSDARRCNGVCATLATVATSASIFLEKRRAFERSKSRSS